jgi:hypothetical protein
MCRRPPQTSTHRRHCACCVTSARYALSPHATVIFFWSFYIVVLFILLNMFISIIMEAAEEVACDFPPTFHSLKPSPISLRSKTVSSTVIQAPPPSRPLAALHQLTSTF